MNVDYERSHLITAKINQGDLSEKPGWVRLSIHPTMTDKELHFIVDAVREIVEDIELLKQNYQYNPKTNEFDCTTGNYQEINIKQWFK